MTKNEEKLIEPWIQYHGYLFGFENLYIIDGSDNPKVLAIFQKYTERGLNLIPSDAGLNELANVITEQMHLHKGRDNFIIKMDTDEFLIHEAIGGAVKNGCPVDNKYFDQIFQNLPLSQKRYRVENVYWSIPRDFEVKEPVVEIKEFFRFNKWFNKSIFHSESFCAVDLGGHFGRTKDGEGFVPTPFGIVHYHHIDPENTVRSARQALVSHGYIDESDDPQVALSKLENIDGQKKYRSHHKVSYYAGYLRALLDGRESPMDAVHDQSGSQYKAAQVEFMVKIDLIEETIRRFRIEESYASTSFSGLIGGFFKRIVERFNICRLRA